MQLNRKIGSGSYAVVNVGATGTQGGRTSANKYGVQCIILLL